MLEKLSRSATLTLSDLEQCDLLLSSSLYNKELASNKAYPKNEAQENLGNPHLIV